MWSKLPLFAGLASLVVPYVAAAPAADKRGPSLPIVAVPFFSFPGGNQAENIRPRSTNGHLLVTINSAPQLYEIDPTKSQNGGIIHTFSGYTSLFGIVETATDLFYVIAGNYSGAPDYYGVQGSFSILQVDLRGVSDPVDNPSQVKVSKIVDIPSAQLLDGFGVVNPSLGILATGDAQTGEIYIIDVPMNTAMAAYSDSTLAGNDDIPASSLNHVGINGLKIHGNALYFTNTAKGTYGTVTINTQNSYLQGQVTILSNYGNYLDDFSFDKAGNAFISEPLTGVLFRPAGTTASNNNTQIFTALYGANSNAFGRGPNDQCILYQTFDGAPSGVAKLDTQGTYCNAQ